VCTRLHHDLARLELKVEDDHADVYAVDDLRAMLQGGNGIRAVLTATQHAQEQEQEQEMRRKGDEREGHQRSKAREWGGGHR
jgi:hypothetical protein